MPVSQLRDSSNESNGPSKYKGGLMGAKTGYFVEAGLGMSFSKPDKWVGFYYFPLMVSYWKTSMDWSRLGKFFC